MADCCSEIRAELAALKAEIAKLKPVDEEAIIQKAVQRSEQAILPKVGAIALALIVAQISPFKARLATVEGIANDGLSSARQALERAYAAQSAAGAAQNIATSAANQAGNALSKAGEALSKIAALAAALAALAASVATLLVLGSRIDALESYVDRVSADISRVLGLLPPIKSAAEKAQSTAEIAIGRADQASGLASAANSTANVASGRAMAAQGTAQQAQTTAQQAQGTAQRAQTTADEALALAKQPKIVQIGIPGPQGPSGKNGKDGLQGPQGKDGMIDPALQGQLNQINQKLNLIPPLIIARTPLTYEQAIQASATGTCRTTQTGGCINRALQNTAEDIKNSLRQNDVWGPLNYALNTEQVNRLKGVQEVLGPQIYSKSGTPIGFTDYFKMFNRWAHLDRVLNILIWWQTLHNAAMLSNNIVQTLASAFNNVLAFLGIKDLEGNAIDIGQILGKTYQDAIKAALGEDTYNNLNKVFNAANRIYQSAANIAFAIQSIQQSILNALEVVGAGVAKIANALKAAGQVFDAAYEWMNPTPNFDNALFRKLENIQQVASNIEFVSQTPLDVQSAVNTMKEERNNMKEALKDGENALKGLGIIESENQKKAADERKEDSAGQDLKNTDKLEAEDE
ncbi:MAG: collagen-like protein [Fischerella sp.]|uniref:hypothetical protein n=1 Tax=Fischerella sp. TaxID=1191 RepID=UPI0017C54356|nr:hypothetical protein [Fischerella sp.]NWF58118.1 collagen-like protein [Fischerella sp.]